MRTLQINVYNDSILQKILWLLEHFKADGVEVLTDEDIEDIRLYDEAKKDKSEIIPFEQALKEIEEGKVS